MNCPRCKTVKLSITHTFQAGENAETRNLKCPACGFRSTSVTLFQHDRARARSVKKLIESGAATPQEVASSFGQTPERPAASAPKSTEP